MGSQPGILDSIGGIDIATGHAGSRCAQLLAEYGAKHGVIGLTRSAARDFADQNIRVNALLAGKTLTPMLEQGAAANHKPLKEFVHAPMKRKPSRVFLQTPRQRPRNY